MTPSVEHSRSRDPLLQPLLLAWVVAAVSAGALQPLLTSAYALQSEAVLRSVRAGLWIVAGAAPLIAFVKAGLMSAVAWSVLVLAGALPRFRALLSATLLGEVLLAAQGVWVAVVLHIRGGAPGTPEDLIVFTALDAFVADPSSAWAALARGVGPFQAAWVMMLAALFASRAGVGRLRGAVAAAACWGAGVGVSVLRALMAQG